MSDTVYILILRFTMLLWCAAWLLAVLPLF